MAIDTDAKKLALMTFGQVYQAALPGTGTLAQADLQHMLWGYIDPLWAAPAAVDFEVLYLMSTITQSFNTASTITQESNIISTVDQQLDITTPL